MRLASSADNSTAKVLGRGEYTLGIGAPYAMTGTSSKDTWMVSGVGAAISGVDDAVVVYIRDNGRKTTIPERIPAKSSFFICHLPPLGFLLYSSDGGGYSAVFCVHFTERSGEDEVAEPYVQPRDNQCSGRHNQTVLRELPEADRTSPFRSHAQNHDIGSCRDRGRVPAQVSTENEGPPQG